MAGVIDLALEAIEPLDIGHPRVGKTAGGQHDKSRRHGLAVGSSDLPDVGGFIEDSFVDAGIELNIGAQIETVGDVVGVFQNFRLRRVALTPVPVLLQLVGERIGILHAFDVTAGAWIAVPVPGASDATALLIDSRR